MLRPTCSGKPCRRRRSKTEASETAGGSDHRSRFRASAPLPVKSGQNDGLFMRTNDADDIRIALPCANPRLFYSLTKTRSATIGGFGDADLKSMYISLRGRASTRSESTRGVRCPRVLVDQQEHSNPVRKRGVSMNLKLLAICGALLAVLVTAPCEAQAPKPDYKALAATGIL